MSSSDPAAPVVLRPYGASVICILVWALLAGLAVEALFSAGLVGLFLVPGLALVAALIWAVLWAPRLELLNEGVRVRNLLHNYSLPFARIEQVRLGAMVSFEVDDLGGRPRRVNAWNAPGIGRDNPLRGTTGPRTDSLHPAPSGASLRTDTRRRLSRAERMRRDQEASRSAAVRDRWEDWHHTHPEGGEAPASRSLNLGVFAVLGVVVLSNLALRLL